MARFHPLIPPPRGWRPPPPPGMQLYPVLRGASEGRSRMPRSGPRRSCVATVGTGYAFEVPQAMTAAVSVSGTSRCGQRRCAPKSSRGGEQSAVTSFTRGGEASARQTEESDSERSRKRDGREEGISQQGFVAAEAEAGRHVGDRRRSVSRAKKRNLADGGASPLDDLFPVRMDSGSCPLKAVYVPSHRLGTHLGEHPRGA
ncbi:uncharacterized protein LOC142598271 [Balearica regulorum gibbericeps]|uniref:uncharacterized protein LOC142598271 n=1 Tax=Balearica regulorum gibbericeps TaxID=100784 RepID=UPI003F62A6BB